MELGLATRSVGQRRLPAVLAWAVVLLASAAAAEPRGPRDIAYDYLVTSYCGVLTPDVERGFRLELAAVTARLKLTPEAAKAARIEGFIAADLEWNNRGLGGFRAWCASDGAAAHARFSAIAAGAEPP